MKNVYKKLAALTVMGCVVLAAAGAQGFKMSAGGGGYFDALFSSVKMGSSDETHANTIGGGFYGFFDATYAEIDLDMLFNSMSDADDSDSGSLAATYFGFSLLGKYPIALGPVTLFPLVGIDYQLVLGGQLKDKDGKDVDEGDFSRGDYYGGSDQDYVEDYLDHFSIAIGAGLDYPIGPVFLRAEVLYNIELDNKSEADLRSRCSDKDVDYKKSIGGPRIKIGVGYTF